MKILKQFGEKKTVYAARIAFAVAVLVLIFDVAHTIFPWSKTQIDQNLIMQGLLDGSLMLCWLLIEAFNGTDSSLKLLQKQQEATLNVSRLTSKEEFDLHWTRMLDQFDSFTVWGKLGADFAKEFSHLATPGGEQKRCSYYLPVDENSKEIAFELLRISAAASSDAIKLFDTASFGHHSWIVARNRHGHETEALVCFAMLDDDFFAGFHMSGSAADDFAQCILGKLKESSTDEKASVPVRLYTDKQIRLVLKEKLLFRHALLAVDKGELLKGPDEVCHGMINQLENTQKTLKVTHVCREETLLLMKQQSFREWLQANYAAAERNVAITRIFVIAKALKENHIYKELAKEMQDHKVKVLVCESDHLDEDLYEDFSIYDDSHVIYIERKGGAWKDGEETASRQSDSSARVASYQQVFEILESRSEVYRATEHVGEGV